MKRIVKDATKPFVFEISAATVKMEHTRRRDKNFCVIAQALRGLLGIRGVEVGAFVTLINTGTGIIRYMTPLVLQRAIRVFDATGEWKLDPGVYRLLPPVGSRTLDAERPRKRALNLIRVDKRSKHVRTHGRGAPRVVNSRVLEFAKLRIERGSFLSI